MTWIFAVAFCLAASLGGGAIALRLLGLDRRLSYAERVGVAALVGLGIIGWLMFWPALLGLARPWVLGVVLVPLVPGLWWLRPPPMAPALPTGGQARAMLVLLAVVLVLYLAIALGPPADADTLAYHFARPRQILAEGRVVLVPKMIDGITPLLVQMTYLPALAVGGERALTVWATLTGLLPGIVLGVLSRRWLPPLWSLAATVIVITVPAWVFGASGGQVETRLAGWALVAAVAVAEAGKQPGRRWEILAGMAAGFYFGGKILGLVFAAAAGAVLLVRRRPPLVAAMAFAAAAVLAGGQWYVWTWAQTGDPVFPMLFQVLNLPDSDIWTRAHDLVFKAEFFQTEVPERPGPFLLISYLLRSWLGLGPPGWEAGRSGLGPFLWLALPLVLAGAWAGRDRVRTSLLSPMAVLAVLFYVLWILSGSSQRIRHLLPVLPIIVLVALVCMHRAATAFGIIRPAAAILWVTVVLQLAGQGVFAASYLNRLVTGQTREGFLTTRVAGYPIAAWANANLGAADKILIRERQILYYLDVPYYYGSHLFQAMVDLRYQGVRPVDRWAQMRRLGITHVAAEDVAPGGPAQSIWQQLAVDLLAHECARPVASVPWRLLRSRSLPGLGSEDNIALILALTPETCDYEPR